MKKQRLGMHQWARTHTRRARAKGISPMDAHAYMPLPHGWRNCQSTRTRTRRVRADEEIANRRTRAHGAYAPILTRDPLKDKTLGAISTMNIA